MQEESKPRLRCFLAIPYREDYREVRDALRKGVHDAGSRAVALDEQPALQGTLMDAVQGQLARADCVIADLTGRNPNVYFEIGLAQAMGKGILLCATQDSAQEIPFALKAFFVLPYDKTRSGLAELSSRIAESLRKFRRLPGRARLLSEDRYGLPFFIDWDQLERPEAENLCQELLAQMGYQRVDWAKESPEIDLIAELPKKDPDGFEYRELWLVSMGRHMPPEMLFEFTERGSDYLVHRLLRRSERLFERIMSRAQGSTPVTVLIILLNRDYSDEAERLRARLSQEGMFRAKEGSFASGIRFRLWDRAYLTSLVQQFPQIGYKYFSDEGRARSKYRKTPDELYRENIIFSDRQAKLIRDLEDEKNKRVRAERDAVWKDISFSAAHKIGNPIFAIETDLGPLDRRVREARTSEALEVVGNVRASVEKAKAIIDQFKSLTRAQEIKPVTTPLKPILEDASRVARNHGVQCTIECPDDLFVFADPERLAECFDELAVNCTHWFDKPEKILKITAARTESLSSSLDSSKEYALIHVSDNGSGVRLEHKTKIFDAFFTTYEHGTGLGLALVRRIIDGHGGMVTETGSPGQGADFEVFLPLGLKAKGEDVPKVAESRRKRPKKTAKNIRK